jgi:hypothetical protein
VARDVFEKEPTMYVIVHHRLTDPQTAFARGAKLMANEGAPSGVQVLQFYPSRDGSTVVCLWEAPSVDAVQQYADDVLGDASVNTSYEVDADQAFSRPPSGIAESPRVNA